MKQIYIFGASTTHGVGGARGGWADGIKQAFHQRSFGPAATGEYYEVYELGIPGQTLPDVQARFVAELEPRRRGVPAEIYLVLAVGLNDSKAVDAIDNHLSSPDDFAAALHSFIHLAKDYTSNILCVGLTPVDESKTTPREHPGDGSLAYFSNDRIRLFEEVMVRTCDEEGAYTAPLYAAVPDDWQQQYLYADGIHPNDAGHAWMCEQVKGKLQQLMDGSA